MKKNLAECLGTFTLVLFGYGAAGISLAFGLTVVVLAYAIGPVSGCHINPAITLAMLLAGNIRLRQAIGYLIAQFVGATLGTAVLYLIQQGTPGFLLTEWALGSNGWGPGYLGGYNTTSAFLAETVLTFLFILMIFKTTATWCYSTMAGLAIGLTLVVVHLVAIPITGISVNPARSFGPELLAGGKALQQVWLFLIASTLGGLLAALVWKGLLSMQWR